MAIDRRKFMLLAGASCAVPLAGPALAKSGRAPWGELARRLGARFQPEAVAAVHEIALDEVVAALRRVDDGQAMGKVIITP